MDDPNVARSFSVYIITNTVTDKAYVGFSVDVRRRYRNHWTAARKGIGWMLHDAMRKHGKEAFVLKVLESGLSREEAAAFEIAAIQKYQTRSPLGYNLTDGGDGARGYRHTEEWKRELGLRQKGRVLSPDAIERMRAALTGRKMSEVACAAMAKAQTGRTHSVSVKQKMSESAKQRWVNRPKIVTSEEATRLRNLAVGRVNSSEHNEAISRGLTGIKRSKETREKLSIAALNRAPGHNEAIRQARLGATASIDSRAKMSTSQTARWARVRAAKATALIAQEEP